MNLLELCEPVFQYVCKLNRMGRSGAGVSEAIVRADILGMLQELQQKSGSDARGAMQVKQLELPLVFFVDSMIAEGELPFAATWNQHRLAYERFNELAGDEKFFDLLEQTLQDSSPEASERLAVYYVCLGLGFTGVYFGQPEQLRRYAVQMLPRIRELVETDQTARICKDAYENVDTRDLTEPPSRKMQLIVILFVFFTLSALTTYYWMFRDASDDLRSSLNQIFSTEHAATK
jgi:type IV/VI secretion system ImpK/VasF family protein